LQQGYRPLVSFDWRMLTTTFSDQMRQMSFER
jgi:hypothetical protein